MAAPKRNRSSEPDVRKKIQTSQLVNRLQSDALGKITLEDGRRRSIEILLRKSLPDLSAIELTGADGGPLLCSWLPVAK